MSDTTPATPSSFNLIDEPWLPCLTPAGERVELSLHAVFDQAHQLAELRDPSPVVTAALHRLLLAILHAAYRGPRSDGEWAGLWEQRQIDIERVGGYLDQWRCRFDLIDPERPFYQIAGFELEKTAPMSELAAELAKGNNPTLFDHTFDSDAAAQPAAVAARWLVGAQAAALGGGKGPTSNLFDPHPYREHSVLVGGAVAMLRGRSLFETLMLNLVTYDDDLPIAGDLAKDKPAWEQDPPTRLEPRPQQGYLDYLTWQSRAARLIWQETPNGLRARGVMIAQGQCLAKDENRVDPMFFRRPTQDGGMVNVRLSGPRALWRDCDSLFAHTDDDTGLRRSGVLQADAARWKTIDDCPLRCAVLGLANDRAKVELWRHEEFPAPLALLTDVELVDALSRGLDNAEKTAGSLRFAARLVARTVLQPANPDHADRGGVDRLVQSWQTEPRYWTALDLPFREFLDDLPADRDAALSSWRDVLYRAAVEAFDQTTRAAAGRRAREMQARVIGRGVLLSQLRKVGIVPPSQERSAA